MPFHIGSGCLPATISNRRIYRIAWSDTPPEMSSWEKMKEFFCSTHQTEALECIWTICHPPAGTTREDVVSRFELLRTLAYAGWEESIHSGQHGENYFCILDEDSQEILSVTLDDAGNYTVNCQGYSETHRLTLDTAQGEEGTGHAEGASGTFRTSFLPATTAPQTPAEYDAVWSAWRRAAPAEESRGRAAVVQKMRACLNNGNAVLNVGESGLTTLPDCLPAHITTLVIPDNNLTSLPALPPELRTLEVSGNQLTSLPVLPPGLLELSIFSNPLTHLPALPSGLCKLWIFGNQLTSLPVLPPGLQELSVSDNQLASLPALPSELCKLWAYNNQLTSLPTLPSGLQELSVSDNQLASLPTLPSELYKLWAYNNRLTSLPALPSGLKELIVSGNRLTSLPVLPSELKELMVSGNRLTSLPMLPSGLLSLSVYRNQLTRLPESLIHLSSETTVNLEGNPLSERTLQALREITSAPGYSGPIIQFDMAGASAPRETRALHLAAADWLVPAREKVRTLALVDEIEVWLAYQNKLKKSLGLTSVTAEMRFFDVSGVTVTDLQDAELQVKAAEKSEFREWILQWGPLHRVLERKAPERVNALREKQISDYEETYRMLSDTELRPSGLVGNTDAERTIGARAMESAKKTFLDGLRPLVEEMLGSYLNVQWRRN